MWAFFAALALGAAVLLAPGSLEAPHDAAAPPAEMVRTAALGRTFAASDVMWLRTVQVMGDPALERRHWPGLESWVDVTTLLDPTFETPYFFGTALLVADPARAEVADRLLERGQRAFPDRFSFPMMRGFIAYFSRLDPASAAVHYHEAARLPDAPPHLEAFARRLETQVHTCSEMLRNLGALAAQETPDKQRALLAEREPILIGCAEGQLKNAAAAFRNRQGRDGSLEELAAAGLVGGDLYTPMGRCWIVTAGRPSLVPCAASEGPP